jgi:predicted PurR-regulated permease PerM
MSVMRGMWTTTTKRVVLTVFAAAAILLVWHMGEIVVPFLWAFVLGYVLLPAVAFLERRVKMRRGYAALIVFVALVGSLLIVLRLIVPLAVAQVRDVNHEVPSLLRNAQITLSQALTSIGMGDLDPLVFLPQVEVSQNVARMVVPVATAISRFALELLICLVATFFVLRDAPKLFDGLRHLLPRDQRRDVMHITEQVNVLIGRYIRGQMLLVAIMSSVTAVGLTVLEVPYSILLGFVTGVLELIPFAGPITAGAIASIVALGHPNPFGWSQLAYVGTVVAMYTVLRHAEDYFVIPLVIGRIVKLHPIVVIFSMLAGGSLLGLLGIILAVPVAATLRLVLVYVLARLRDEDPLPELEREMETADQGRPPRPIEARPAPGQAR